MPMYITVLDSNSNLSYWRAVQTANYLNAIQSNPFYTAGITTSVPKNTGDNFVESKMVTEVLTGARASAGVYRIATSGSDGFKLMSGTAPKSLIKKLQRKKRN